jgi:two-component system, sensor histidine kinase and response regulator
MLPEAVTHGEAESARSILVVDDNEVNALIMRAMLRKHGYEPLVAPNGREGIAMVEAHRPRLVLMDLQMPCLDGYAATAEIRRRVGPPPVIVAVTANAGSEVRAACQDAGFAGVLAKPVVIEELIALVRRHLG